MSKRTKFSRFTVVTNLELSFYRLHVQYYFVLSYHVLVIFKASNNFFSLVDFFIVSLFWYMKVIQRQGPKHHIQFATKNKTVNQKLNQSVFGVRLRHALDIMHVQCIHNTNLISSHTFCGCKGLTASTIGPSTSSQLALKFFY